LREAVAGERGGSVFAANGFDIMIDYRCAYTTERR